MLVFLFEEGIQRCFRMEQREVMEYAGICDIGKKRSVNQDSILMETRGEVGLFVVADGMGGHSHGELASQCIINEFKNWWDNFSVQYYENDFRKMMQSIQQRVQQINRNIYREYNQNSICGSTMIVLFICKKQYGIIYVGDSRIYQCAGRHVKQLSNDEIWENQVGLGEQEKRKNWKTHSGKLVNAMGIKEEISYRVITDEFEHGNTFLLCSDGLYKFCSERQLKYWIKKARKIKDLKKVYESLLDIVYKNGAGDNISIVVVR